MKIVIPVSKADASQLDLLVQVLLLQGPLTGHDLLLVPTPSVDSEARQAAEKLKCICASIQVATTEFEFPGGWPQAPNNHWHWAATYLERTGNRQAWLWLEIDCVPMVANWATLLEKAYVAGGKPFFGCVKPLLFTNKQTTEPYTKAGEDMLMGVAIYPHGIPRDTHIQPLFNNMGRRGVAAPREPFDVYLRWVFKHRGVASTTLIVDRWRTCNYRLVNDQILCDPVAGEALAKGGVVPKDTILLHGVKDGSLQRLLLNKGKEVAPAPVVSVPEVTAPPAPPVAPVVQAAPAAPAADTLEAQVLAFITESKVRVKDVVEHFKLPGVPEAVRIIIPLGYSVASYGWVVKKE